MNVLKNKRILITCGPTWIPIDSVRVISNLSSGTLGQIIAGDFSKAGAKVTLIEGPVAQPLKSRSIKILKYNYFDELSALMKKELMKKYDVCIHAAAVADYKLKHKNNSKLSSNHKSFKLELVPTQKIIHRIKKLQPNLFLVGFKLEPKLNRITAKQKTRSLFRSGKCDLVVANSLSGKKYSGYIIDKNNTLLGQGHSRNQLSKSLINRISKNL